MELEDAGSFTMGQGCCNVDLRAPTRTPPCKDKEGEGSARAGPVAAPIPKSDSF